MSGETLTVGSLIFKDGVSEKIEMQILESLAEAIEVEVSDLHYNIGQWSFQSPVCGAVEGEQPDSRTNEVLLRGLPL